MILSYYDRCYYLYIKPSFSPKYYIYCRKVHLNCQPFFVTELFFLCNKVWDAQKNEGLGNYRGHLGRVHCVAWSYTNPDVLFSGSEDFCLHRWKYTETEHKSPPSNSKWTATMSFCYLSTAGLFFHDDCKNLTKHNK